MGIFSLFGKKDQQPATPADTSRPKPKRSSGNPRSTAIKSVKRDVQAARETALKIDAIESEMSSEFVTTPAAPARRTETAPQPMTSETAAEMGNTTRMLLDGQTSIDAMAAPSNDSSGIIEEAAVMYANGQQLLVEQMLSTAVDEDALGENAARVWLMLFDLYQLSGKQTEFERLAIAYANKFETSPPAWSASSEQPDQQASGTTPSVPFTGRLDAACGKHIERIQKLSGNHRTLRLEFERIEAVDAVGCEMLLGVLKKLQKSGHELILAGASELVQKIRATLEVGRRDGEAAWLLLLELLCLLNMEQEFEEIGIDYCVTFEVSPPAFVAPVNKISTSASESAALPAAEGFMLPKVIEGRVDDLIVALAAYSDEYCPALIDCSRLTRIDFQAAGRLLTGLSPFCNAERLLEFHHVNHLVAELFNMIGLHNVVRIYPRKN